MKQIPIVRQGAGNQPAPYLFFTTGRPVLMGLGKTIYGPFWQGKTPLWASRQAAASGSASGCNISCKWFASGDFENHLQTISRQEIHGESLGIFQVGSHGFVGDYLEEVKMAQKKSFSISAGQSDLFGLFSNGNVVPVKVETPPSLAIKPALTTQPAGSALPDGWKEEDIRFLLGVLEDGPILVADSRLGIPTIHEDFGAEVVHCGYGVMKTEGPGFKIIFDAGGGMERTPSGKGWTRLTVEGKTTGPFKYDKTEVRKKLMSYLPATDAPQIGPADLPPAPPEETAGNQNALAALTRDRSATLPSAKIPVQDQVKEFNSNLGYFTGTEKWTRYTCLCPHIILLTDGALYVAEHGGEDGNSAFWLIDAIASYQGEAALKHHDFQVWKLWVLTPDQEIPPTSVAAVLKSKQPAAKERNPYRHAVLTCTNGNEKELVRQEIELTDFLPVGEITMYASVEKHPDISNNRQVMILLLPSEY